MKLRNKKTGEIGELYSVCEDDEVWLKVEIEHDKEFYNTHTIQEVENFDVEYNSLAELNEEWEDYEEPKEFYYITGDGYITRDNDTVTKDFADDLKSIGNYFETNEEALEAVEKLKAWKRLKDKGFRFTGFYGGSKCIDFNYDDYSNTEWAKENRADLDLLFGGE